MKRLMIMFITMAITVGGAATAEAKQPPRSERTVQGSYGPYPAPVTACNGVMGSWACMVVPTRPTERFVNVKVTDTHGLPVYFLLSSPGAQFWAGFCGETKGPVPFWGGHLEIEVGVSRGVVQTDCPANSVKTTGTIRVTLSDQR
ncbi:MAG TPA: hypothetical protein VM030_11865 [Acidimicrobiales bacterium]|nr:hypothetical protein [Acidimicrobiales bacterium]